MSTAEQRREQLKAVYLEARDCTRCALAETRTTVIFGAGNANADLMFVGEAPGANEDKGGLPFIGQAGRLLDRLLQEVGLERADVFIANVLKCRPPGNRDPRPTEIEACREYLHRQVELIQPTVICTLGNFSTKLLRDDPTGISRVHGQPEVHVLGSRAVRIFPIYHPAAALYTPSMLETLRADFALLPDLLASGPPPQPEASSAPPPGDDEEGPTAEDLEAFREAFAEASEEQGAEGGEGPPTGDATPPRVVADAPAEAAPEQPRVDQLGLF